MCVYVSMCICVCMSVYIYVGVNVYVCVLRACVHFRMKDALYYKIQMYYVIFGDVDSSTLWQVVTAIGILTVATSTCQAVTKSV